MSLISQSLTPRQAWTPINHRNWDESKARHLLRRIGFSATPGLVQQSVKMGLYGTLEYYFGERQPMAIPYQVKLEVEEAPKLQQEYRATQDQDERQQIRRQQRMLTEASYQDYATSWLTFARGQRVSPQEKYVMFLQNIFVVGRSKVRSTALLYNHQNLMRKEGFGSYPELAKAVSRSPAMIQYLDLNLSTAKAPNENFARELFELFTLGEGNYTERDIKQAARAFTGYRFRGSQFNFQKNIYDTGPKTVFGRTGHWNGDEVIDIVYDQPAAATFVPREFIKFYMCEDALPEPYLEQLGRMWSAKSFSMPFLIETVFTSRIFYEPQFQGNLIKSPIHYYLGLCQDLNLDVTPFPTRILASLRGMGQIFQSPPNVRGWVGGKHWINATTLAARRLLAQSLFHPIDVEKLNADDYVELQAARAEGRAEFSVTDERLSAMAEQTPEYIADHFCRYFLPGEPQAGFRDALVQYLHSKKDNYIEGIKEVTVAILQSPQYQLS